MKLHKDQALGISGLAVSAFFFYATSQLAASNYEGDPGPKMFPLIGCVLLALCSIYEIVRPRKKNAQFMTKAQYMAAAKLFVIYLLSILMFWLLGFEITVAVLLFIVTFIFSKVSNPDSSIKSRIIKSIIYAVVGFAALYVIYKIGLSAQLPRGLIWKLTK